MNDDYETLQLLEETHSFPCPYLFKVIGRPDNNFVGRVLAAVRSELPPDAEPPFSSRKSAKANYVSVSIEPIVENGSQVVKIYKNLCEVDGFKMVL